MENESISIADMLRSDIAAGRLGSDAPIRQDAIAARLKVSRTPIRQALRQLAGEGFVTYDPNRGARVATVSSAAVRDLFDMRLALEPLALEAALPYHDKLVWARAEMALDRADVAGVDAVSLGQENSRFHGDLYEPSGRSLLLETVGRLTDRGIRAEIVALSVKSRVRQSALEHRDLLRACIARDEPGALRILRGHLEAARDDTLAAMEE